MQNEDLENTNVFKKRKRTIIVIFLGFIACIHSIANNKLIYQYFLNYNVNNNLFTSLQIYSWPNIVLPFFLGFVIDYMGENYIMLSFLMTILFAQGLHMTFIFKKGAVEYIYLSSIFFSLCGESFLIPLLIHVETWFEKTEIAKNVNYIISSVSLGKFVRSLLITLIFTLYHPEKNTTAQVNSEPLDFQEVLDSSVLLLIFIGICFSSYLVSIHKKLLRKIGGVDRSVSILVSLRNILSKRLLMLALGSGLLHCSCFLYYEMTSGLARNMDEQENVRFFYFSFSIVYIISILSSTFCIGKYLDIHGTRTSFLFLSGIFLLMTYSIMAILIQSNIVDNDKDLFYIVIIISHIFHGCGFALHYGSIYTIVPCIVRQKDLGLGFGFLISFQNIFCMIVTYVAQNLNTPNKDENGATPGGMSFNVYVLDWVVCLIGIIFIIILERIEQKEGKMLVRRSNANADFAYQNI